MTTRKTNKGFNATMLQIRRAYRELFGEPMPSGITFQDAGKRIVEKLGLKEAERFVLAQSNDPTLPD